MALLGQIIKRYLKINEGIRPRNASPVKYQQQQLKRLLRKARNTQFGKHYAFDKILQEQNPYELFSKTIPIFNYNSMYKNWWCYCQEGDRDVSWPGKVKYFALSSGTSESASKHIPVTDDMIKSVKKTGFKQFVSLQHFDLPSSVFSKGVLMLGGTTALFEKGDYFEGDMSGISIKNMPRWLSFLFYKPGQRISERPRWEDRIRLIVRKAKSWDVSIVCGVPAWVQIVFEEIIKYHKVNNIHEIWPNLSLYIHGGVSIEPYRESFKKLFQRPITFIETYMASEGSFGFQSRPGVKGISLVTNNFIFYEFVPFDAENFTEDGEIKEQAKVYRLHEVEEGKDYAVIISTCAGAWRYLIGDVLRFTSVERAEIIITGRTKQFLSLCGEHLSVDNMNKAIEMLQKKLQVEINEFTVHGYAYEGAFAHKWFLACDEKINEEEASNLIDTFLCELNDDYAVERSSALKKIAVHILPEKIFMNFLASKGKIGAMSKFPRVMKGKQLEEWLQFLEGNCNLESRED